MQTQIHFGVKSTHIIISSHELLTGNFIILSKSNSTFLFLPATLEVLSIVSVLLCGAHIMSTCIMRFLYRPVFIAVSSVAVLLAGIICNHVTAPDAVVNTLRVISILYYYNINNIMLS